jgi:hypothetical protein
MLMDTPNEQGTLLHAFISLAESDLAIEAPITINVHGVIMEGIITSRKKYMTAVLEGMKAATLRGPGGQPVSSSIADGWTRGVESIIQKISAGEPKANESHQHMYIRDVAVMNITKLASFPSIWCVRLDSIGAWTMGHSAPNGA